MKLSLVRLCCVARSDLAPWFADCLECSAPPVATSVDSREGRSSSGTRRAGHAHRVGEPGQSGAAAKARLAGRAGARRAGGRHVEVLTLPAHADAIDCTPMAAAAAVLGVRLKVETGELAKVRADGLSSGASRARDALPGQAPLSGGTDMPANAAGKWIVLQVDAGRSAAEGTRRRPRPARTRPRPIAVLLRTAGCVARTASGRAFLQADTLIRAQRPAARAGAVCTVGAEGAAGAAAAAVVHIA